MQVHNRSRRSAGLMTLLMCLGAASPAAWAQGTAEERSACTGDAFRFCLSDIPNVSEIEACLKSREAELDPACRAEFQPTGRTRMRREHFR